MRKSKKNIKRTTIKKKKKRNNKSCKKGLTDEAKRIMKEINILKNKLKSS